MQTPTSNERKRAFIRIKEHFDREDMRMIEEKGISVFNTSYGLYGSSSLHDVFELFSRIHLERYKAFVDLGSGDGRIALLASLFTTSAGIEGDAALHNRAMQSQRSLAEDIAECARCNIVCGDYTQHDLSQYDVLFIYADHNWPEDFQKKLLHECKGILFSLHNIYRPQMLKKGKTYWISQTPFVSYALNVPDDAVDAVAHDEAQFSGK